MGDNEPGVQACGGQIIFQIVKHKHVCLEGSEHIFEVNCSHMIAHSLMELLGQFPFVASQHEVKCGLLILGICGPSRCRSSDLSLPLT